MTETLNPQLIALSHFSSDVQAILNEYHLHHPLSYLSKEIIDQLQKATSFNKSDLGLMLLPLAASFAIAPISNFHVGAVAFDSSGNAYLGANFEFSATHIGQTIHAEQSAIINAWENGATELSLLVINYAPCGHCRQFINEVKLSKDFLIQLPDRAPQPLSYFLPEAFGPDDFNIKQVILSSNQTSINTKNEGDTCLNLALQAYSTSHAPYSNSKSAVAVQFTDKTVVTGRYAENAAFNPTLPALQAALNIRRLQGKDWQAIERAIMIESSSSLQQKNNATNLLKSICDIELEYHLISED